MINQYTLALTQLKKLPKGDAVHHLTALGSIFWICVGSTLSSEYTHKAVNVSIQKVIVIDMKIGISVLSPNSDRFCLAHVKLIFLKNT